MCETGACQKVAQLLDSYMAMMFEETRHTTMVWLQYLPHLTLHGPTMSDTDFESTSEV
jgi:hypothetical protein